MTFVSLTVVCCPWMKPCGRQLAPRSELISTEAPPMGGLPSYQNGSSQLLPTTATRFAVTLLMFPSAKIAEAFPTVRADNVVQRAAHGVVRAGAPVDLTYFVTKKGDKRGESKDKIQKVSTGEGVEQQQPPRALVGEQHRAPHCHRAVVAHHRQRIAEGPPAVDGACDADPCWSSAPSMLVVHWKAATSVPFGSAAIVGMCESAAASQQRGVSHNSHALGAFLPFSPTKFRGISDVCHKTWLILNERGSGAAGRRVGAHGHLISFMVPEPSDATHP